MSPRMSFTISSFLLIVYNILFFICLCVCSKYMKMYAYKVRAVHMNVWGHQESSWIVLYLIFLRQGCSPNLEFTYSASSAKQQAPSIGLSLPLSIGVTDMYTHAHLYYFCKHCTTE